MPKRVLVIYASTGGGHKSAALALEEALRLESPEAEVKLLDIMDEYAPPPFDRVLDSYNQMIRSPAVWKQLYELTDGRRRSKVITQGIALLTRKQAKALLQDHPSDVIVSTFHFANAPLLEVLEKDPQAPPFVTVVTDLVTTPPVWY